MISRGTEILIHNSKINYQFIEQYSENIDVNQLYNIIQPNKKLSTNEIFPVNDVKKMREAQQKNILSQIKACNLQKEFYEKFKKQIKQTTPIWKRIDQIQHMSNQQALQQYRYYKSINIASQLQESSEQEESIAMESGESLNAKMFQDNFNYLDYEGNQEQFIHNQQYQNIFQNAAMNEPNIYDVEGEIIQEEYTQNFLQ